MRQRPGDQPLPVPNEHLDVQSQVIADLAERRKLGIDRYGTALQPHNGRDADRDAYEEAMDLTVYLKQRILERDEDAVLAHLFRRMLACREMYAHVGREALSLDGFVLMTDEELAIVQREVDRRG